MTVKLATAWRKPTEDTSAVTTYSSPTTTYNSPTAFYSGPVADSTAHLWSRSDKPQTRWSVNPAALANRRAYDTHITYDAHVTYDGLVAGEDVGDTKTPTIWRQA